VQRVLTLNWVGAIGLIQKGTSEQTVGSEGVKNEDMQGKGVSNRGISSVKSLRKKQSWCFPKDQTVRP
jgi:hypothetical protein